VLVLSGLLIPSEVTIIPMFRMVKGEMATAASAGRAIGQRDRRNRRTAEAVQRPASSSSSPRRGRTAGKNKRCRARRSAEDRTMISGQCVSVSRAIPPSGTSG